MAELADARDLKSRGRKAVWVRSPPPAPTLSKGLSPFHRSTFWRASIASANRSANFSVSRECCDPSPTVNKPYGGRRASCGEILEPADTPASRVRPTDSSAARSAQCLDCSQQFPRAVPGCFLSLLESKKLPRLLIGLCKCTVGYVTNIQFDGDYIAVDLRLFLRRWKCEVTLTPNAQGSKRRRSFSGQRQANKFFGRHAGRLRPQVRSGH